jgi:hypothetical protein
MKYVRVLLALLIPLSLVTLIPSTAVAANVAPMMNYANSSGLSFVAVPAQWSVTGSSKYQWLINGKAIYFMLGSLDFS